MQKYQGLMEIGKVENSGTLFGFLKQKACTEWDRWQSMRPFRRCEAATYIFQENPVMSIIAKIEQEQLEVDPPHVQRR